MPAAAWILLGLAGLVIGAELIVRHGAKLAARLGVPSILVGLTIVSLGTSAPELAVGIDAVRNGSGSLAVGNIAGTNVANLLLILGLSAAIRPLAIHRQTIRIDLPGMAIASLLLLALSLDSELTVLDGAVLALAALVYVGLLIRTARREPPMVVAEYEAEFPHDRPRHRIGDPVLRLLLVVAGIALVVLGAEWLVRGSVDLASSLGVPDSLIGLTIIALGTSAPELATTVVATVRGDPDIAIGNLIGSSTFNVTAILGTSLLFAHQPVVLDPELIRFGLPVMVVVALICVPVFITGRRVSRLEGGLFVTAPRIIPIDRHHHVIPPRLHPLRRSTRRVVEAHSAIGERASDNSAGGSDGSGGDPRGPKITADAANRPASANPHRGQRASGVSR